MLSNLPALEEDILWKLMGQFRDDPRDEKIDLIVGVYRDETGQTPVMKVVQEAEIKLADKAESKGYKLLSGNMEFNKQMARFLLGEQYNPETNCTIQTVGGTGALRVLADFIHLLSPDSSVWVSDPGYINHRPIFEDAGLKVMGYPWRSTGMRLDMEVCLAGLEQARAGDVLVIHGCCHNPTGVDPNLEQWQQLLDFCQRKNITPLIDMAYQGFADHPDQDAAGLRLFAGQMDTLLIAASCSKNMGLYCERTGVASVISKKEPERIPRIRATLERITRANYSMPPNHGSEIATELFDNFEAWQQELSTCRNRISRIRQALGRALNELNAPESLKVIAEHKGMFSLLPFTPEQMAWLKSEYGIYGVPNGRINVAGLKEAQVPQLVEALMRVVRES